MFILVKAENEAKALDYILAHVNEPIIAYSDMIGYDECHFWIDDKHHAEVIKWYCEGPDTGPYPMGTLMFYSIKH